MRPLEQAPLPPVPPLADTQKYIQGERMSLDVNSSSGAPFRPGTPALSRTALLEGDNSRLYGLGWRKMCQEYSLEAEFFRCRYDVLGFSPSQECTGIAEGRSRRLDLCVQLPWLYIDIFRCENSPSEHE